jgi:predicted enzyme related to lactoylglutathione lyase
MTGQRMIKSLAFTVYSVTDVKRARAFYEGTLGLTLTHNYQDEWLEFELGNTAFVIASQDADHQPGRHGPVAAFEVADIAAFVNQLKSASVIFNKDLFETPVCTIAIIQDPDANEIILHQRKSDR